MIYLECWDLFFQLVGLLIILGISLSIKVFHIIWALILRIKSFIPRRRKLVINLRQRTGGVAQIYTINTNNLTECKIDLFLF